MGPPRTSKLTLKRAVPGAVLLAGLAEYGRTVLQWCGDRVPQYEMTNTMVHAWRGGYGGVRVVCARG